MRNNQLTAENILSALALFTGGDELREWMNKPFIGKNHVIATNGHFLMAVSKDHLEFDRGAFESLPGKCEHLWNSMDFSCLTGESLSSSSLEEIISCWPTQPKQVERNKECDECNGEGIVECDECGHEHDCESCNGLGAVITYIPSPGETEINATHGYVKIGRKYLNISFLQVIKEACEIMGVDEVDIPVQDEAHNKPLFLNIPSMSNSFFVVMPLMYRKEDDPSKVIVELKPTKKGEEVRNGSC